MRSIFKVAVILASFCITAHAHVFDVPYEKDDPTRTLLLPAKNAKAVVLLFPGGSGVMKLKDDGSTMNPHTFVRSKNLWAQYGIHAVLVDTPYGLGDSRNNIRYSRDHQQRMFNVVKHYKEKFNLPVWLMGHSMSTTSVTIFANHGKDWEQMIAGIIVTGTHITTRLNQEVMLPTLAIHHTLDSCRYDPVMGSESIIKSRPAGVRKQLTIIEGGDTTGDPCLSMSYHGFYKTEDKVVDAAAKFILGK